MKKLLGLICITLFVHSSFACTTFFINHKGQLVFGRNYDWITGNGMVYSNQRGLLKTSFNTGDGPTASWTSKYGSITFNQYGKEFPTGGMNEKGLVIELMWLDGTEYPLPDQRPALGVLQWIQYHLDKCSTIEEVIAEDKNIRIASKGTTPLHYLIADANGNAATIEFLDNKMVIHKGKDLPFAVLTNDRYDHSVNQTKNNLKEDRSFTGSSLDRFAEACKMVTQFSLNPNTPVIDYSFRILDNVAQGSHTKWSIVYDLTNKKIYFKSLNYPQVKQLSFSNFDFNCTATPKYTEINQSVTGDLATRFQSFTIETNSKMLEHSFDESKSQINVRRETIEELKNYPYTTTCVKN